MTAIATTPQPASDAGQDAYLLRQQQGAVVTLTLNRGARMNPLSSGMLSALQQAFDDLAGDSSVRVIVLAASGAHFCAGHDLREMRANPDQAWQRALFAQCSQVMLSMTRLPQPVIARVQGYAAAAGCQLVSMCDLAVAGERAAFALPGIRNGIFCSTPGVGVLRNLSRKRAMEMLLTGDMVPARQALEWGLVNRVLPDDELESSCLAFAQKIAAYSPAVLGLGKRLFYEQADLSLEGAYGLTAEGMACNMMFDDAAEGIDAFLQKRAPAWSGR